jgi:C-terminal processing protease CtpA/Prc
MSVRKFTPGIALVICAAAAAPTAGEICRAAAAWESSLPPAQFEDGPLLRREDILADLDGWMAGLRALNPDLSLRSDTQQLETVAERIRTELTGPTTRREAWLHLAQLNPYLHDGHAGVQMPHYREALEAHLQSGGRIVPVEVRFAPDRSLRVLSVAGSAAIQSGDRLRAINGHDAQEMIKRMSALAIGDTADGQRAWLERRFAMLYWYLYGDTGQYDLTVQHGPSDCPRQVRLRGAESLPEALEARPSAHELFGSRVLSGGIGYLRVDGFDPDQKVAFASFTQASFAQFRTRRIRALIIDVRENGGGDDPLWQQSLVDHFTRTPYVQLSHYVQRITQDNADPGDVIGAVRSADYHQLFTPPAVDPVRFAGPVYILDGPYSYSATIQFIVASQDYHLARIAGEETAALACQTGQVKPLAMPRTGLAAVTPIIAYTRPSGHGCDRGVIPDVPIAIDELRPDATLDALADWIRRHP